MNKSGHAHEHMHPPFTHMTPSCNTYKSVISQGIHMKTSDQITHMNAPRYTSECILSHLLMRQVRHMNASCHTCGRVISLI